MTKTSHAYNRRLILAGASLLALYCGRGGAAPDTQASTAQVNLGLAQATAAQTESVIVKARRRLLKEKNSPSAVTELGARQIASTGVSGSAASLLRQAPSVYVYQQGLGDNAPELTVRAAPLETLILLVASAPPEPNCSVPAVMLVAPL